MNNRSRKPSKPSSTKTAKVRSKESHGLADEGVLAAIAQKLSLLAEILMRLEAIEARLEAVPGADNPKRDEKKITPTLDYLSLQEAAKTTSLSYSHVRRAVVTGELPASNVGGRDRPTYRIARHDLDEWIRTKRCQIPSIPSKAEFDRLKKRYFPDL